MVYSTRTDFSRLPEMIKMLSTNEYMEYENEANLNDGLPVKYTPQAMDSINGLGVNTDWQACLDAVGGCESDRTGVELSLIQNDSQIDWSISMGVGEGSMYSGTLCSSEFNWRSLPGTLDETGCWTFSQDEFNKTSLGSTFRCVGAGSRGADSTPATVPTCAELAVMDVDYEACPPQP